MIILSLLVIGYLLWTFKYIKSQFYKNNLLWNQISCSYIIIHLSSNIVDQLWSSSSAAFWWSDICFGHWPTLACSMREQNLPGLLSLSGDMIKIVIIMMKMVIIVIKMIIIMVKEGIYRGMRFNFGSFYFQGVDHSDQVWVSIIFLFFLVSSHFVVFSGCSSNFFRVLVTLALLPQVPGIASHGPLTPNILQVDHHTDYADDVDYADSYWPCYKTCWSMTSDHADHADYADDADSCWSWWLCWLCWWLGGAFQNAFHFPGSFCCLECCSSYCLFCQPLLKRCHCQNGLRNICEKSNKLVLISSFLAFLHGFTRVAGHFPLKKRTHTFCWIFIPAATSSSH